jgi:hypothetical protein
MPLRDSRAPSSRSFLIRTATEGWEMPSSLATASWETPGSSANMLMMRRSLSSRFIGTLLVDDALNL